MRALGSIIAATTLITGFGVAQASGNRPAGGAVLLAGGAAATWAWLQVASPPRAGVNAAIFTGAFVASHPLAKHIGARPSVFSVAALTAGAT
ncbi:MAG: hypothetical protein QG597_4666 [Actinomycetota bacterium]|nr:hypothetical protein [Actinomycetota bacterium]